MARFEQRIHDKVASNIAPVRPATVLNSYYAKDGTSGAFADVLVRDGDVSATQLARVPILKIGGVSVTLPPVGMTALVSYVDNNDEKPFIIGFLDSEITEAITEDDRRPRKPPTSLTR